MPKAQKGTEPQGHDTGTAQWLRPRAVLFDLDGTLYDQRPLRKAMVGELLRSPLTHGPLQAWRIARVLKSFRRLREALRMDAEAARAQGRSLGSRLEELQFTRPAKALGLAPQEVKSIVDEWMFEKPLKHLVRAGWPELRSILQGLKDAGLQLGVFSDYPPEEKLRALGVQDLMEVALSATDEHIDAFKPDPTGFGRGAELMGVDPSDVVYVGDRWDVDATGADAAGMRAVILETGLGHVGATGDFDDQIRALGRSGRCRSIQSFGEVGDALGIRA